MACARSTSAWLAFPMASCRANCEVSKAVRDWVDFKKRIRLPPPAVLPAIARRCFALFPVARRVPAFRDWNKGLSRAARIWLRVHQAMPTRFQRAASACFSLWSIRFPRLPAVSIGTSKVHGDQPGAEVGGNLPIVAGIHGDRRIRPLARRDGWCGLCGQQLRASLGQGRLIVECCQRELSQIPRFVRPRRRDTVGFRGRPANPRWSVNENQIAPPFFPRRGAGDDNEHSRRSKPRERTRQRTFETHSENTSCGLVIRRQRQPHSDRR